MTHFVRTRHIYIYMYICSQTCCQWDVDAAVLSLFQVSSRRGIQQVSARWTVAATACRVSCYNWTLSPAHGRSSLLPRYVYIPHANRSSLFPTGALCFQQELFVSNRSFLFPTGALCFQQELLVPTGAPCFQHELLISNRSSLLTDQQLFAPKICLQMTQPQGPMV